MTALEDLWYGNIDPRETILKGSKQFKNLLSLMGRNRDKHTDTFTNQQREMLEKYGDTINEMHSLAEVESFTCGFSLGIRLMMESILIETTTED